MPSIPTHLLVGAALGQAAAQPMRSDWRFWTAALVCSALPDVDVIDSRLTCNMGFVGHRGMTHSILFAALVELRPRCFSVEAERSFCGMLLCCFDDCVSWFSGCNDKRRSGNCVLLAVRSDAILFPWKPILVSADWTRAISSQRGAAVLGSEIIYVWLPALAIGLRFMDCENDRGENRKTRGAIKNN